MIPTSGGVNAFNQIFRIQKDSSGKYVWKQIAGSLKHVSVASDGTVWGVNANDEIFKYQYGVSDAWKLESGSLQQISVGSANLVWGVNANNEIYRFRGR